MYQTKFFVQGNIYALQVEIDKWIRQEQEQRPSSFEIVSVSYAVAPSTGAEKVFIIYKY